MPKLSSSRRTYRRKVPKKPMARKRPTVQRRRIKPQSETLPGLTNFFNGTNRMLTASVLPNMHVCTMNYTAGTIVLNNGGSGLIGTTYYWRLNDVFAPDFTNTVFGPHQPYGYDQIRGFYKKSTVLKCKVSIRLLTQSTRTTGLVVFVKQQGDVADPATQTLNQWNEKPNSWVLQAGTDSQPYQNWVATFDIAKQLGLTKQKLLNDDLYSAIGNSSPGTAQTLLIGLACGSYELLTTQRVVCEITLNYTVAWQDPVIGDSS